MCQKVKIEQTIAQVYSIYLSLCPGLIPHIAVGQQTL